MIASKKKRVVPGTGIEPASHFSGDGFSSHYGFRRQLALFVRWTMPSPWRSRAVGAPRLVSTPSPCGGLARRCLGGRARGFTEFEEIHSDAFAARCSNLSPLCLPISPPRHGAIYCTRMCYCCAKQTSLTLKPAQENTNTTMADQGVARRY